MGLPPNSLGDDDSDFQPVARVLDEQDAARAQHLDKSEVDPTAENAPLNDESNRELEEESRKRKEHEASEPDWEIQFSHRASNDSTDAPIVAVETMPQTQHFAVDDEENDDEDELEVVQAIRVPRKRTNGSSPVERDQRMNENKEAAEKSNVHVLEGMQANADEVQANPHSITETEANPIRTSDNTIMTNAPNSKHQSRAPAAV